MAYSNSKITRAPTALEQLLEEINFQRTKEMRQYLKDDSGFVMLQGTTYWTDLFVRHFLFQNDSSMDCDDLLFFVRKKHVKGSPRYLPKFETEVDVFRKDSRKLPIGDPDIDWEETVYLNLIIHQFEYTLTLAICTRTSPKELQVLKRHSQKVYASPSRRRMDTKGELEEITYPHICFMVENFDEIFQDILVRDGEMVCVELLAADRSGDIQGVIFLGSIRYDALKKVYDARQSSLSTKMAQRMTFGLFSTSAAQRCEFVRMKGPQGKGHAEMAVTKPKGSGVETPTSEPGFCATDLWNSDWEEDSDDFFVYKTQRRLSDPSANINNFVRGGWKSKLDVKARSESEGLDSLENGVSEIEAGDLRDDKIGSASTSNSTCCGCFQRRNPGTLLEMYRLSVKCDNYKQYPGRMPFEYTDSELFLTKTKENKKMYDKSDDLHGNANYEECEFADDAISLNEDNGICYTNKSNKLFVEKKGYPFAIVNGKEELPCIHKCYLKKSSLNRVDQTLLKNPNIPVHCTKDRSGKDHGILNANSRTSIKHVYGYCTLPKIKGKLRCSKYLPKNMIPPKRITPDGTHIYYWCDVQKKENVSELDDGAYNPLWTMKGFTQTFHFWKEHKRAQSVPLNAFLTYVTLPWWSIAKDILDHREGPILTFQ